ncbi:MAG TPA: hypothetical protein VG099_10725, partial [Gemmataceae bacterium]|nr:hypothetical protein [Gemmataceae bacterium]
YRVCRKGFEDLMDGAFGRHIFLTSAGTDTPALTKPRLYMSFERRVKMCFVDKLAQLSGRQFAHQASFPHGVHVAEWRK